MSLQNLMTMMSTAPVALHPGRWTRIGAGLESVVAVPDVKEDIDEKQPRTGPGPEGHSLFF